MSNAEITSKVETLRELEELIEEAKVEVEAIKDELKAHMIAMNTEELNAGRYILRYVSVLSNRFDSTAFKKVMPDVYKAYIRQTESLRFTISK